MNGTPLAGLWADAVAGVCVAAAVAAPAATHAARLDPAAPTLVADADQASLTPTRLTARGAIGRRRHVAASRAAAAARDVAEAAAAAAAYAGSHRAAAAAAALKDAVAALRRADAPLADAAAAVSAASSTRKQRRSSPPRSPSRAPRGDARHRAHPRGTTSTPRRTRCGPQRRPRYDDFSSTS